MVVHGLPDFENQALQLLTINRGCGVFIDRGRYIGNGQNLFGIETQLQSTLQITANIIRAQPMTAEI
jgi:hypothetical protein